MWSGRETEPAPVSAAITPNLGASPGNFTDEVSGAVLDLWIDLVRQSGTVTWSSPGPTPAGLTRAQAKAVECLSAEAMSMSEFARGLEVTSATATAIANRLTTLGATVRHRNQGNRRQVLIAATPLGMQMARSRRVAQLQELDRLLSPLEMARAAMFMDAMRQLAGPGKSPNEPSAANWLRAELRG